jgi:vacuolar protein sorting-associated protein 33A
LSDPHTAASSNNNLNADSLKNKKKQNKNWDAAGVFPIPKILQTNVIGTKILLFSNTPENNTTGIGIGIGNGTFPNERTDTPRTTREGIELPIHKSTAVASAMNSLNPFATSAAAAAPPTNTRNTVEDDIYWSPTDSISHHVDVITYLIRPWDIDQTLAVIRRIQMATATINSSNNNNNNANNVHVNHLYHRLVYVPQITAMVSQMLQDAGMVANTHVTITSLQLDVFPMESDLFSLEYTSPAVDSLLETPSALIQTTARALAKLQDVTGTIARIQSLGPLGEDVLAKLLNNTVDECILAGRNQDDQATAATPEEETGVVDAMDNPQQGSHEDSESTTINSNVSMLLLDRRLDMVTPMVTPLTYEGLLDEVVTIEAGYVHLDEQIIHPLDDYDEAEKKKLQQSSTNNNNSSNTKNINNPFEDDTALPEETGAATSLILPPNPIALGVHAGDTLYAEVRDQHVEKFGSFLQNQAIALKESHTNFTSKGTKKDLHEIHQFVKQIPVRFSASYLWGYAAILLKVLQFARPNTPRHDAIFCCWLFFSIFQIFTQSLRSLTNHIHLAELIKSTTEEVEFREQWNTERAMIEGETCYDILEDLIFSSYPPYKLLRLWCLQSLTSGGVKANRYDSLRQSFVQVYGYQFLPVLHDLEKLGWIKRRDTLFLDSTRSPFQSIRRNLILIHAEVDTVEPDDVSYVSSGYAPLSVRLVQSSMQGWNDKKEVLQELFTASGSGGRLLDIQQVYPPQDLVTTLKRQQQQQQQSAFHKEPLGVYAKKQMAAGSGGGGSRKKKPTLMVVYLGGITYMEIAALRFLSKRDTFPYHVVIVTTQILNGSKLIQQLG